MIRVLGKQESLLSNLYRRVFCFNFRLNLHQGKKDNTKQGWNGKGFNRLNYCPPGLLNDDFVINCINLLLRTKKIDEI